MTSIEKKTKSGKEVKIVEFEIVTRRVITLTRDDVIDHMSSNENPMSKTILDKVMKKLKKLAKDKIEETGEDRDYECDDDYDICNLIDDAIGEAEREDKIVLPKVAVDNK